jgi:hypothetical protein
MDIRQRPVSQTLRPGPQPSVEEQEVAIVRGEIVPAIRWWIPDRMRETGRRLTGRPEPL